MKNLKTIQLTLNNNIFFSKILLGTGIFLLSFTAIWIFIITDEFEKLDENYYHYEEQLGINSMISENGELSEPFPHHNVHEIKVVNKNNDDMKITSRLIATNMDTDEVFLDETRFYDVNAKTKAHQSIERGFFVFPNHVEKRDYFLTFPLSFTAGIFSFVQETKIHGLPVYEFDCVSKPYDITNAIPLFKDSIVKSIYNCKIWVEPITGQHVDFNLSWESYFKEDGKLTTLVEKGNKKTTSEYVEKFVEEAKINSIIVIVSDYFIPFMFLTSGSVFMIYPYLKRTKEMEKTIKVQTSELIKAEKMALIGTLSARVAHDIRNPLSIIRISLENLKEISSLDDKKQKQFDKIDRSIDRIAHQVDEVLGFVREQPLILEKAQMSEILADALDSTYIPNNVRLVLPKNDVELVCDKKQLSIVLVNLILNSIQAIKGKGMVAMKIDEKKDSVIIEIEDSGKGIPKDKLEEIFDPLFTTKQTGTGLGLASVKSIVESHGGTISVTSPPTIFKIELPKKLE